MKDSLSRPFVSLRSHILQVTQIFYLLNLSWPSKVDLEKQTLMYYVCIHHDDGKLDSRFQEYLRALEEENEVDKNLSRSYHLDTFQECYSPNNWKNEKALLKKHLGISITAPRTLKEKTEFTELCVRHHSFYDVVYWMSFKDQILKLIAADRLSAALEGQEANLLRENKELTCQVTTGEIFDPVSFSYGRIYLRKMKKYSIPPFSLNKCLTGTQSFLRLQSPELENELQLIG